MLIHYLARNFHLEQDFLARAQLEPEAWQALFAAKLVPDASYKLSGALHSTSFMGEFDLAQSASFHCKGHLRWLERIQRLGVESEPQARALFESEYDQSNSQFFTSTLGMAFINLMPDLPDTFDKVKSDATWQHFLNGTYGVCTVDGMPTTVFLKQVAARFIERLIGSNGKARLEPGTLDVLSRAVDFLDRVEANFAPHELSLSSRQRCIISVRQRYFPHENG